MTTGTSLPTAAVPGLGGPWVSWVEAKGESGRLYRTRWRGRGQACALTDGHQEGKPEPGLPPGVPPCKDRTKEVAFPGPLRLDLKSNGAGLCRNVRLTDVGCGFFCLGAGFATCS